MSKAFVVMNTYKNCKNYAFSGALIIPMSLRKQESCSAEAKNRLTKRLVKTNMKKKQDEKVQYQITDFKEGV